MKFTDLKIFQFALPFDRPVKFKDRELNQRQGILIKLTADNNTAGYGEISPLPDFSRESFNDARQQIKGLAPWLLTQEIGPQLAKLDGRFDAWLAPQSLHPSVRFGIESAVLNLLANSQNKNLGETLSLKPEKSIAVNALLQGSITEIVDAAVTRLNEGYRSFKLKVRGPNISAEAEKVVALKDILHNQGTLRLDANQSLDYEQAVSFGKEIGSAQIEYFEEPCSDVQRFGHFFAETGIPFALDESLTEYSIKTFEKEKGLKAVILKPALLGGIENTFELVKMCRHRNITPVISAAFESGAGIVTLVDLAGCINPGGIAAGLDTLRFFTADLLKNPLKVVDGNINNRKPLAQDDEILFDLLKEVR